MADKPLKFTINADQLAANLQTTYEDIRKDVERGVQGLTAQTHAKVMELANDQLKGYQLKEFLGDGGSNIRWSKINNSMWAVEIDESVMFYNDGQCVVYSNNPSHIPKVLTPDGFVSITEVKLGTMVLNQYGKWTDVVNIIEQNLNEESKLKIHSIDYCRLDIKRKGHVSRIFHSECPKCKDVLLMNPSDATSSVRTPYCEKCFQNTQLVKISLPKKISKLVGSKHAGTFVLTSDHPVMTERGWVKAGNLEDFDKLMIPSWSRCVVTNEPTPLGAKFVNSASATSWAQKKIVAEGRHVSQQPNWLSNVYRKVLKKCGKGISAPEELVSKRLSENGYKVSFYDEKIEDSDCIRQYPIESMDLGSKGGKRYYFIDFYFPKLKLALEIDGKMFHKPEKDTKRDNHLASHGIETIRVTAKNAIKKDFNPIDLILKNHEGFISYLPYSVKIKKFKPKPSYGLRRRWDITVREGSSFVLYGILIHNSPKSMLTDQWLLKNAKTAKDGSKFKVIPFRDNLKSAPSSKSNTKASSVLGTMTRNAIRSARTSDNKRIPIRTVERNADGTPKLGIIHKIKITPPLSQSQASSLYSAPRTPEMAAKTGLKAHGGIFKLEGLAISQRQVGAGVKREAVTFRVASSKQKGENRWMYPAITPHNFLQKAFDWAQAQWPQIQREIELKVQARNRR